MEAAQDNVESSQFMWALPSLSQVVLVLGLIWVVKLLMPKGPPVKIPPFPVKPYPIVGHLPYFKGGQRPKYKEWRNEAGDIYSLYFGSKLFVVLCGYKVLKEAFVKKGEIFSDRPPTPYLDDGDKGLIFANGHTWKEHRTISINILRSFGFGKSCMSERINEEVAVYLETLAKLEGKASDIRTITSTSLANIICSLMVGRRFSYDDPLFNSFIEAFMVMVSVAEAVSPVIIWPWLRFIPGNFLQSKSLNRAMNHVQEDFSEKFIQMSENGTDEDNYIAVYLREMKDSPDKGNSSTLNRDNLRRTITQLFLAGTETTSSTLQWLMVYLLQAPDIQAKVHEELDKVIGTERTPQLSDQGKLPYTMAVIRETQRLSSIFPQSLPHWCIADTEIGGYTIPANTTVIGNLDSILHDGDLWEEPMKFKPERFLDAHGKLTNKDENVPFSIGRRLCMGDSLAKMELFLYATAMIQRFELKTDSGEKLPYWPYIDGITCPPQPFKIRFVERKALQ